MDITRVLLVEDDLANLQLAQTRLSLLGYSVTGTASAKEALDLVNAAEEPFDLALVDLRLPGMNGIELIEHLRAAPATADMPILVVSAEPDPGMAAGADHFIQKPYKLHQLVMAIAVTMEKRSR